MLFNGLFRMVLTNPLFKQAIYSLLSDKDYKKLVPYLKDWMKELPKALDHIRS
jgi:hypothetical protein